MSLSKISVGIILVLFTLGMATMNYVAAGEKTIGRNVSHNVTMEQIEVGDEEGHVLGFGKSVGVQTIFEGARVFDGGLIEATGIFDMNTKTGSGTYRGYATVTDKDGHKHYFTWEGKMTKGVWKGTWKTTKGTGKFEGMKGGGTWTNTALTPKLAFTDWEGEFELPGK